MRKEFITLFTTGCPAYICDAIKSQYMDSPSITRSAVERAELAAVRKRADPDEGFIEAAAMESRDVTTDDTEVYGTLADREELRMLSAMVLATAAEAGESSSGCWVSAASDADVAESSSGVGFWDTALAKRPCMRVLRRLWACCRTAAVMAHVGPK